MRKAILLIPLAFLLKPLIRFVLDCHPKYPKPNHLWWLKERDYDV
jgi:hypothetical protein